MMTDLELRKRIMRRVWAVYAFRMVTSPAVRIACLALAMLMIISSVSLPHVFDNVRNVSSLEAFVNFWIVALIKTTVVVQISAIIAALVSFWTVRDAITRPSAHLAA